MRGLLNRVHQKIIIRGGMEEWRDGGNGEGNLREPRREWRRLEGTREGREVREEEGGQEEKEEERGGELSHAQLQVCHGVSFGGAQATLHKTTKTTRCKDLRISMLRYPRHGTPMAVHLQPPGRKRNSITAGSHELKADSSKARASNRRTAA